MTRDIFLAAASDPRVKPEDDGREDH